MWWLQHLTYWLISNFPCYIICQQQFSLFNCARSFFKSASQLSHQRKQFSWFVGYQSAWLHHYCLPLKYSLKIAAFSRSSEISLPEELRGEEDYDHLSSSWQNSKTSLHQQSMSLTKKRCNLQYSVLSWNKKKLLIDLYFKFIISDLSISFCDGEDALHE